MTATQINAERLAKVMALALESGSHADFERGMCVMEAVSYVAGEPWSDAPSCASPVITAFMVSWNDSLAAEPRNRLLKPLIPLLVGTRASDEVEERRSYMALDWLIRVFTPQWLEHAQALRELGAIVDMAGAAAAGEKMRPARDAARAAAWAAVWAARDAARAAARAALKPTTTEWLQQSAVALVHRMVETK